MARKRNQANGHLYRDGNWWRLRWREDAIGEDGQPTHIQPSAVVGRCTGPGALTEKQAKRAAYEAILKDLDRQTICPQSIMTLKEFVQRHFLPEHVAVKKLAGRIHYVETHSAGAGREAAARHHIGGPTEVRDW
jgi:hypothetical protein